MQAGFLQHRSLTLPLVGPIATRPPLSVRSTFREVQFARLRGLARRTRPFQREVEAKETADDRTEEELLTERYLESLADSQWTDDPPGYVAIIGRPNAGKSTLVNAMVGQKLSIVTAKAQTTRHRILSLVNEQDYQIVLLDTPGVLTTQRNKLDAKMMRSVLRAAREADALLAIVDGSHQPEEDLESLNEIFKAGVQGTQFALVLNKVDLINQDRVDELVTAFKDRCQANSIIPASAKLGAGIDEVKTWASQQLPEGPSLYPKDVVSEEPERFFISEIVREHIFTQYREEIPYSSTAEVVDYATRPNGKDLVSVYVTVESDSQKGILIGKGGSALKKLSTAAREGIEDFLGKPVYLDISVKVKKGWRADEASVTRFGY